MNEYPEEQLNRWWCELNCFRWPTDKEFPFENSDDDAMSRAFIWVSKKTRPQSRIAYWNGPFNQGRKSL